uniref:hypothetical protein n=1 Tax=Eubacterium cellulosolvens TaxID=29322 RepID=UPI000AF48A36|nr:hypothetical protein [[Eubacterium] cellulosolvens]
MKKTGKKLAFSAAIAAAALNIGACTMFHPAENEEPEVYGPPNDISVSVSSEDQPSSDSEDAKREKDGGSKEKKQKKAGSSSEDPKSYSADKNMEVVVYGPPESE